MSWQGITVITITSFALGTLFGGELAGHGNPTRDAFNRGHELGWVEQICWRKGGELLPVGDPQGKCVVITPIEQMKSQ